MNYSVRIIIHVNTICSNKYVSVKKKQWVINIWLNCAPKYNLETKICIPFSENEQTLNSGDSYDRNDLAVPAVTQI